MSTENDWPLSELPNTFDWSLSMGEIVRKYSPTRKPNQKVIAKFVKELGWPQEETPTATQAEMLPFDEYLKILKGYPYMYKVLTEINSSIPQWLYNNLFKACLVGGTKNWSNEERIVHLLWNHYKDKGGFTSTAKHFIDKYLSASWEYDEALLELQKPHP
jgi:hypothetical protein